MHHCAHASFYFEQPVDESVVLESLKTWFNYLQARTNDELAGMVARDRSGYPFSLLDLASKLEALLPTS